MRSICILVVLLAVSATYGIRIKGDSLLDKLQGLKAPKWGESRIVNGKDAERGAAPYQVSLQTNGGQHFCSASILGSEWLITAANCVVGMNPSYMKAAVGSNEWNRPAKVYEVNYTRVHCGYDRPVYHNDIALIKLATPIEFDDVTKPIPYTHERLKAGAEVSMTGWGATQQDGEYAQRLQTAQLKYVPHEECRQAMDNDPSVDIGHICTLGANSEGTCYGDSGSPVVFQGYLVGVVNWGVPCARGKPDMHASIAFYHDFIRTTTEGCYWQ